MLIIADEEITVSELTRALKGYVLAPELHHGETRYRLKRSAICHTTILDDGTTVEEYTPADYSRSIPIGAAESDTLSVMDELARFFNAAFENTSRPWPADAEKTCQYCGGTFKAARCPAGCPHIP